MNSLLFIIIGLVAITNIQAFSSYATTKCVSAGRCTINMVEGRSLAEAGQSKKKMFRDLRDKLNKAATEPGFFDVGSGKPVRTSCSIRINHKK